VKSATGKRHYGRSLKHLKPGYILLVEETIRDPHFQTHSTFTRLTGSAGFFRKGIFRDSFFLLLPLETPQGI
jgi:hypothetical protein